MSQFDASKIKEMTNTLVAYDLMRKDEEMRVLKFKHITYIAIAVVLLIGGTISVDAMTDNSISNAVKDVLKIKVNNEDYNAKCTKTTEGNMKCKIDSNILEGGEATFEVSSDALENVEVNADKNNFELIINSEITE